MQRPTPCVGICSTTYGDLVCRGCKRFAHEIVEWNGYATDQKNAIWLRLRSLRDSVTEDLLQVTDAVRFDNALKELRFTGSDDSSSGKAFELLRRLAARGLAPSGAGLKLVGYSDDRDGIQQLLVDVDREFYTRSRAYYERSFKIASL
ncbi:MAG: DUF1289 domain-containing protein [Proteobacteria bacterium]|nr:DUF1289 domain-containing protein [Pseudomonadota bacterium]